MQVILQNWEAFFTAALIVGMFGALITGRFGADIVLLGVLVTLLLAGILTPREAVVGFSNTGVITVALLYVVAAGLKETGAMAMITAWLLGKPRSEVMAQLRIFVPTAAMSAFVNNTPIVAMFLPVLSGWARRFGFHPSRLFLPLSYAAILGGVCTLIGTSTNLVVSGFIEAYNRGLPDGSPDTLEPFRMFTTAWVGVPMVLCGVGYVLVAGRWLLPTRDRHPPAEEESRLYTTAMQLRTGSPIAGKTIENAGLRGLPGLYLARIERDGETIIAVDPETRLEDGDTLVFVGQLESVVDLQSIKGLEPITDGERLEGIRQHRRLIEAVISPGSPLVGRSIREGGFRTRYGAVVVAVHRHGERLPGKLGDIRLRAGDTLLLEAPKGFVERYGDSSSFYLVSERAQSAAPRHERAWAALAILLGLMFTLTFELLDTMVAAMAAAGSMVLLRCCTGPQARASVDWQVLIVIGAAFGIGRAMEKTGLASFIADAGLSWAVAIGPVVLLATVYVLTVVFTQMITNNAAAILMFPIALEATRAADLNFLPFAVCIAAGASCEFMTPIGYQTNLMVMGPGGYKWIDYIRFGGPLQLICGIACVGAASVAFGPLNLSP